MGGVVGTFRDAYGVREFARNSGGSNVGMLTPTRMTTSSYVMVASIFDD